MKLLLKKEQRLKNKKNIQRVFKSTKVIKCFPLKCIYIESDNSTKVGVFVPKKNIKFACDRNIIKRRIRESYRVNQFLLKKNIYSIFLFCSKITVSYDTIEKSLKNVIIKLNEIN